MKNWVIRGLFWGTFMLIFTGIVDPWIFDEPIQLSRLWIKALIFYPMGLALFLGLDKFQKTK